VIVNATTDSFESDVLNHTGLVLVDFWAPWCGPCQKMNPVFEYLSTYYEDKAKIVKVNADEEVKLVQDYKISSIPTTIFFLDGEEKEQIVGAKTKAYMIAKLNLELEI
jgi:thioredoxin 1